MKLVNIYSILKNHKLSSNEKTLIAWLAVAFTLLPYSIFFLNHDVGGSLYSNWFSKIVAYIVQLPLIISSYIGYFFAHDPRDYEDLGAGLMGMFISPFIGIFLWYCLFYIFGKIESIFSEEGSFIRKHVMLLAFCFIIISAWFYYASKPDLTLQSQIEKSVSDQLGGLSR